MNRPVQGSEHVRVRRFIAMHMVAVSLIYGIALVMGEGFAAAPFPPDEVLVARADRLQTLPEPLADFSARAPFDTGLPLPQHHDIALPWSFDPQGRLHLRDR
ncbi:MAG: hypothetical protein AB7U92_20090 [Piscinibacter sp.]|uniref:hypothetical protein n=1 Tax=Piscinibacter sp. TaxID=1903157 RepID=UPI003D148BA5